MKSFEQIAKAMFMAHEKELRSSTQRELLTWDELPQARRDAWIAAARQAAAELALMH